MSSLPKVPIANQKVQSNQASQKASANPSPNTEDQNPTIDLSRKTNPTDVVVAGKAGHDLLIHDNFGDYTQFYRFLVTCKCNWHARVQTFEQAKLAADNHVYQNTKPRMK